MLFRKWWALLSQRARASAARHVRDSTLVRTGRRTIGNVEDIRETFVNLRAWLAILQWQQDEENKQAWRDRRKNEGTSLWEWLDFITPSGEIEWRGEAAWGTTGWPAHSEPVRLPPPAGSTSHYWHGFRAGVEHERRRQEALATT